MNSLVLFGGVFMIFFMYSVLFQFGPFTIKTAGVLLILGVVTALLFFAKSIKNRKIDVNFLTNNLLWILLITFIGARIGGSLIHWQNSSFISLFRLWDGNYSFYIGLIFFIISFIFFCKKNNKNYWRFFDVFILPFFIVVFFANIGHFFNGTNYGTPFDSDFWPTVTYNSPEVRFFSSVHPVQFYAAFWVLICFVLVWIFKRKRRIDGVAALFGIIIYYLGELFLEFIRGDPVRLIFDYRISQIFDLFLMIAGIIILVIRSHKKYLKIKTIK